MRWRVASGEWKAGSKAGIMTASKAFGYEFDGPTFYE